MCEQEPLAEVQFIFLGNCQTTRRQWGLQKHLDALVESIYQGMN